MAYIPPTTTAIVENFTTYTPPTLTNLIVLDFTAGDGVAVELPIPQRVNNFLVF